MRWSFRDLEAAIYKFDKYKAWRKALLVKELMS